MNYLRTSASIRAETEPRSLAARLGGQVTPLRGQVRKLPDGVPREQAALLRDMILNGVSDEAIKGQLALMAASSS